MAALRAFLVIGDGPSGEAVSLDQLSLLALQAMEELHGGGGGCGTGSSTGGSASGSASGSGDTGEVGVDALYPSRHTCMAWAVVLIAALRGELTHGLPSPRDINFYLPMQVNYEFDDTGKGSILSLEVRG